MDKKKTYQLLMRNSDVAYAVDKWAERDYGFDMRVRRARLKGHTVLELTDSTFAALLAMQFGCSYAIDGKVVANEHQKKNV